MRQASAAAGMRNIIWLVLGLPRGASPPTVKLFGISTQRFRTSASNAALPSNTMPAVSQLRRLNISRHI
jgi:hypothetical protein